MNELDYSYFKEKVFALTGIDLSAYKSQQMHRRLDAFIVRRAPLSVAAYCRTLEQDKNELKAFLDFLTINVSEFFRDVKQFQSLKEEILPKLLQQSPELNIWSAACSCGQEPYTIALILEELCPYHKHRILATDIDDGALERAKQGGPYLPAELKNVPSKFLHWFFEKRDDGYWVKDRIKNAVEFRRHNLLYDSIEHGFDLVVCRNVVIYFTDRARTELYQKIHRCLKQDGVLFVGGSEVMLRGNDMGFTSICPSFYRKIPIRESAVIS